MNIKLADQVLNAFQENPWRTLVLLTLFILSTSGLQFIKSYVSILGANTAKVEKDVKNEPGTGGPGGIVGNNNQFVIGNNNILENNNLSETFIEELKKRIELNDEVIDEFRKTLKKKQIGSSEQKNVIVNLAEKYHRLETRLSVRSSSDGNILNASRLLKKGDFIGAEYILRKSMKRHLVKKKFGRAFADAKDLGTIKELQLDFTGADKYHLKANQIESIIKIKAGNQLLEQENKETRNRKQRYKDSNYPSRMTSGQKKDDNYYPRKGASERRNQVLEKANEIPEQKHIYMYHNNELWSRYDYYDDYIYTLYYEKLMPNLSQEELSILSDVEIELLSYLNSPEPFYVKSSIDQGTIYLPIRTIAVIEDICHLASCLYYHYESFIPGELYARKLAISNPPSIEGYYPSPLSAFGLKKDTLDDTETQEYKSLLFESAISFFISHELGHIYYNNSDMTDLKSEIEADNFALEFIDRSGIEPWAMGPILIAMYRMAESNQGNPEDSKVNHTILRIRSIEKWIDELSGSTQIELESTAEVYSKKMKHLFLKSIHSNSIIPQNIDEKIKEVDWTFFKSYFPQANTYNPYTFRTEYLQSQFEELFE